MWERLGVLAFSVLLVCGAPALAIYMLATHEAVGVGAVFLILACLVVAGVGALCGRFLL